MTSCGTPNCSKTDCLHKSYTAAISKISTRYQNLENRLSVIKPSFKVTFTSGEQRRRGGSHGRGGRLPSQDIRDSFVYTNLVFARLSEYVLSFNQSENTLDDKLLRLFVQGIAEGDSLPETKSNLYKFLTRTREIGRKDKRIQVIPHAPLGILVHYGSTNTSRNGSDGIREGRDRHSICTWIDEDGNMRCTCCGSMEFKTRLALRQMNLSCSHVTPLLEFVKQCLRFIPEEERVAIRSLISNIKLMKSQGHPNDIGETDDSSSVLKSISNICVLRHEVQSNAGGRHIWVPLRNVKFKRRRLLCCFCDKFGSESCVHETLSNKLFSNNNTHEIESPLTEVTSSPLEKTVSLSKSQPPNETAVTRKIDISISRYRISAISCETSHLYDDQYGKFVELGRQVFISCPIRCTFCNGPRKERSRKVINGSLTCTKGPAAMAVETYTCANKKCSKVFCTEGREYYICLHTFTSACTHVFIRNECEAAVCGIGPLNSRLNNFQKRVFNSKNASIINTNESLRSTPTLFKICKLGMKLMTKSVPQQLFECPTCKIHENNSPRDGNPRTICIDAIYAGYQSEKAVQFKQWSMQYECQKADISVPESQRPLSGIFRKDTVARVILSTIQGKPFKITDKTIQIACHALRVLQTEFIPLDVFSNSICGSNPRDMFSDIGENSVLFRVSKLLKTIFDVNHAARFLRQQIFDYLKTNFTWKRDGSSQIQHSTAPNTPVPAESIRKSKRSMKETELYSLWQSYSKCGFKIVQVNEGDIMWRTSLEKLDKEHLSTLFKFVQLLILNPVTNIIKKKNIMAIRRLVLICKQKEGLQLQKALLFERNSNERSILRTDRLLFAGFLAGAAIEQTVNSRADRSSVRPFVLSGILADVLEDLSVRVQVFYTHYSNLSRKYNQGMAEQPSLEYLKVHSIASSDQCQAREEARDPYVSGAFFPGLPQIRPTPFQSQDAMPQEKDNCSKTFVQGKHDFTPGALTFCCSCTHPIIVGFQVLERNEGTRAVLNILLSRFHTIPEFVVYDFACGLSGSALNTLWWATENTKFVSDKFHIDNHTACSPSYNANGYPQLDKMNTVSHEQRNQRIAQIKGSLQRMGQELYIAMLSYHTVIHNIESLFKTYNRSHQNKKKVFEADKWYCEKFNCYCCLNGNRRFDLLVSIRKQLENSTLPMISSLS